MSQPTIEISVGYDPETETVDVHVAAGGIMVMLELDVDTADDLVRALQTAIGAADEADDDA